MTRGGERYRRLQARLDEAGVTTSIIRISPKHFELHVNYEIIKAARTRDTCNRQLLRITSQSFQPNSPIMFFQQIAEIDPSLDLTMRLMLRNGSMTVEINPAAIDKIKALRVTATPAELDEQLLVAIKAPLADALTIDKQVDAFKKEVKQQLESAKKDAGEKLEKDAGAKPGPTAKKLAGKPDTQAATSTAAPSPAPEAPAADSSVPTAAAPKETKPVLSAYSLPVDGQQPAEESVPVTEPSKPQPPKPGPPKPPAPPKPGA